MTRKNPFKEYEELGEERVRKALASGDYGRQDSTMYQKASGWLSMLDKQSEDGLAKLRDDRESEIRDIAKEANRIASNALAETRSEVRLANRSRWIDRIIPTIAIIIAVIAARDDIKWLISWLLDKLKTP